MTTGERQFVRAHLLKAGFRRDHSTDMPNHYDRAHDGVYTEVWKHQRDRTRITLEWDKKTQ